MKRWIAPLFLLGTAIAGLSAGAMVAWIAASIEPTTSLTIKDILNGNAWAQADNSIVSQSPRLAPISTIDLPADTQTYFGTVAGGGAPGYNEIALEKNVLYFQRTLSQLGFKPILANLFFANGNDGQATVRYLDERDEQQFKAPDIPDLTGAATYANTRGWFQAVAQADKPCPAFFYFTGHGAYNADNEDDNWLLLWEEAFVSVKEMAGWLEPLPADQPFVTMMAQCYSGAFANLIYENGDPEQPVALQTRCGFFATVASRPSVGCTPAVNEADYKDYSSSFFAGLSGRDRIGNPVASADYNQDSQVSYAEAHAFAKVDEETTDWPISTVEAWLQRQLSEEALAQTLAMPIEGWGEIARPEQQYVIDSLTAKLSFDPQRSYLENAQSVPAPEADTVEEAYHKRLEMELANVSAEKNIRETQDPAQMATLEKILRCEAGFWQ